MNKVKYYKLPFQFELKIRLRNQLYSFFKKEIIVSKIEERKGIDQANLVFAYHVPLETIKEIILRRF